MTVQPVTLGVADGERSAIDSGLRPGDTVVIDGADRLRDGAKVSRWPAAAGRGAAGGAAIAAPMARATARQAASRRRHGRRAA